MAQVKCTKIELVRLRKKLSLFRKYLPTLQLKKMLLQLEVNKAREELCRFQEVYQGEKALMLEHAHLLTDPFAHELEDALKIEGIVTGVENIAGIQVPVLEKLSFRKPKFSLVRTPLWIDTVIEMIRKLEQAYQKTLIGMKKREILQRELRTVSIRVNLFEKRMIPELEKQINQIRIFLGDQELQAVAQAKVSKGKILKHKLREGEMVL